MERNLKIHNEILKFKVGSLQPLLSDVLPVAELVPADVLHPGQMSPEALTLVSRRLLDLGGSGDCFFLAVHAAMSFYTRAKGRSTFFDPVSIYNMLGIEQQTYIEDDHIAKFAGIYPFSIVVVREYKGICYFCQFGRSSDIIYLFNEYPNHYLLFDQIYFDGATYKVEDLPRPVEVSVASTDVPLVTQFPSTTTTTVTLVDDPDQCVIEDPDLNYLYQYVDTRYQIRKAGFTLKAADSKAYFKLRHNVFKTTFLNLLGLESVEEKPFTMYGVDSVRTPDLILTTAEKILIVEFTVVKKFATSLRTKQSQNKYEPEVLTLESQGWDVKQLYPTLSLDEGVSAISLDILEIANFLAKEIYEDPEPIFAALQSELNSLEFNISELIPELLLNQEEFTQVEFKLKNEVYTPPIPFNVVVQKMGMKRQRDQNTYLLIRKNSRALERQLKLTKYNAKFVILINKTYNSVYADVDVEGIQKNVLLSMLQNNSPDCVRYVKYIGKTSDTEEPFKVLGETIINIDPSRKEVIKKSVDVSDFERYYKAKLAKGERNKAMPTLVDNDLKSQVGLVKDTYIKKLSEKRKNKDLIIADKRWFMFPILTNGIYGDYEGLNLQTGLPLTDRLIRTCFPSKMEKIIERNQDLKQLDESLKMTNDAYLRFLNTVGNNRAAARRLKNIYGELEARNLISLYTTDVESSYQALKAFQEAKIEMARNVGEPTRKAYRNRISFTKSYIKTNWPAEMEHFNEKKGRVKICDDRPLEEMSLNIEGLLAELWQEETHPTIDSVLSETEPLGNGLTKILTEMKAAAEEVIEPLKKTRILHDLEFVSRLAYTLLYYSNIKSNKEDFFSDNLGYKNVLVIVKGGKKILSNKRSRLFKLIFPIKSGSSWLHQSSHSKVIEQDGELYCVWPWQTWTFAMLKKATELYYSFTNYFTCSYLESGLDLVDYKKFVSTKVLNMYSQRRKVEIWFGFFRYLYLNSMATHTSVLDLIEDMVDYEYDPYFSFCQKRFAESYRSIYSNAAQGKIFDMVTGVVVDNFDLCAEKFDESLFMTMAPFDRVNEHLRNLKSVLTTHFDVREKFSLDPLELLRETSVDVSDDDYFKKLASDDLMFDPKLTFAVGAFAGEMLSKVTTVTDMSSEFHKIITKTYTEISTSKGMRSSKGEFWGKKGHDVIFGEEDMKNVVRNFLKNFPNSYTEYKRTLAESHLSYKDKISDLEEVTLEFDLKDKAQWKGSREIYVMSDNTKLLQSPLEKFFKYLCSWTPNELIHKKSHVRPKFIHNQVFEFETGEDVNTYATLDCRKWAPKSNLWKYHYFVKGMSHHLPPEFVEYFDIVWSMMFSKKVRVQSFYIDKLNGNSTTEHLTKYLDKREDGDYEFVMNYSFMMGIFNYLSSLLHAFSQLYFDAKIAKAFNASFNLIAHSDDSGGVIFSKSWDMNLKLFRMYEMYQKGLNHLMSKKKCALSDKFFEMISIMYANKRLIPMTHKFIANVSFEPKGKGWVDDISTIVSKIVEIFSNGGTMLQCYLTMLTMSEMIRKFYHVPRLATLSKIPLAYGGVFNLHPIHLILLGADAQEIMLDVTETAGERGFRVKVGETVFGEYFPGKGVSANYHIPYYKSHNFGKICTDEELDLLKLVSGVIPDTTLGQASGHYSRLRDPAYIYSLTGVDMCQIFTMTLFTKTIILNAGGTKKCDLRKLTTKYAVLKSLGLFAERTTKGYSNFQHYAKASESISLSLKDMSVSSKKTCKPLIYNTFQNVGLGLTFKTVNEIIAYKKEPKLHFMFPDKKRMETLVSWVKSNLQYSDEYVLEDYLMKLSSKDLEKTRSSYCFIPSGISVDTIERFWTYINFYCTRRYYISSKKPQYFTIDQFKLWNADYESLKHMYLLVKIALRCPLKEETFEILKKNANCTGCNYVQQIVNMVSEIYDLRSAPASTYVLTDLPFAVYTQPQSRSVNVWYGRAEFTLYTKFGTVEVTKKLGQTYHIYHVISDEVLDQVHFLLQNFLVTRGLTELDTAYSINDTSAFRLGFGDLRQPRLVYPGERAMQQKNSVVYIGNPPKPRLYKEESGKFTIDGLTVDFEIYQNYDLNEGFYKLHNLDEIKNLIFDEEKYVEPDEMKKIALSSKVYEVLQLDPSHSALGTIEEKYQPGYLLGSERSLTRALVYADKEGKTSYRSTATPTVLDAGVLEGVSHRDIPVLDLIENFSFARVTYKERKLMEKIVNDLSIESNQEHVLNGLIKKLGIKPTMNALTVTRITFSDLVYRDVKNLTIDVAADYMTTMVKSAIMSIDDHFEGDPAYYCLGNKSQVYSELALMIRTDTSPEIAGELVTKLLMRAQKTAPGKFWEHRKENIYAGLIVPREQTFKNQCLFNQAIFSKLGKEKFNKIRNIRQIHLALRTIERNFKSLLKKTERRRKEGVEYIFGKLRFEDLNRRNYYIDEDDVEDELDAISGGDDPENTKRRIWPKKDGDEEESKEADDEDDEDEEDEDEDSSQEDLELEPYTCFIANDLDMRCVCEDTLQSNFEKVTIRSLTMLPVLPWLGSCDSELVSIDGVPIYEARYPGRMLKLPTTSELKEVSISRREAKPLTVEEKPAVESWSGKTKVDTDIFELKTEEEVYNYQYQVLKNLGVSDPDKHSKNFFKIKEVSNEDYFWSNLLTGLNVRAQLQIGSVHNVSRRRSPILPGFTGNLRDDDLRAELNAMFSNHAEEIISGNQCLTLASFKTILRNFKRLYRENTDGNIKAYIIIFLATMRDSVISNISDSWYSDCLMQAIDSLEKQDDDYSKEDLPPPKPIKSLKRDYKIKSPFE